MKEGRARKNVGKVRKKEETERDKQGGGREKENKQPLRD